jgi:thiol-disulfide isomerase/thioredoxin
MRQLLLAACLAVVATTAQALDVGDRMPPLTEAAWIGHAPDPAGRFTVIDLWSPDDPACRATMPVMTDVQRRHPEVSVIGLTAADHTLAVEFVAGMESRVGYAVGIVPALAPYAPPVGAPAAVLIDRTGTVLWWGDALDIPTVLAQAQSSTFVPTPPAPPTPAAAAPAEQPAAPTSSVQQPQERIVYRETVVVHDPGPRVVVSAPVVVPPPWSWHVGVTVPLFIPPPPWVVFDHLHHHHHR